MPEEQMKRARFDYVNDQGDLVFVIDHKHFAVTVDNTLDHAILEAKQIQEEEHGTPVPHASAALPISAIQTMIRAGASTHRVAQEFAVNEAIVRRFATPIETEKKYAIEQFLSMKAPKRNPGGSNETAISQALEAADVNPAAVSWTASRRKQEPWHISASFQVGDQAVQADWSWNMRDNTISCLNAAARRLIEDEQVDSYSDSDVSSSDQFEAVPPYSSDSQEDFAPSAASSQSSVDSSTDSEALPYQPAPAENSSSSVSFNAEAGLPPAQPHQSLEEEQSGNSSSTPVQEPSQTRAVPQAPTAHSDNRFTTGSYPVPPPNQHNTGSFRSPKVTPAKSPEPAQAKPSSVHSYNSWMYGGAQRINKPKRNEHQSQADTTTSSLQEVRAKGSSSGSQQSANRRQGKNSAITDSIRPELGTDDRQQGSDKARGSKAEKKGKGQSGHKKSGRSAVPSWDEILFGE